METVEDLLLHVNCRKSMGPDGIHLRALRELAEVIALHHLSVFLVNQRGLRGLKSCRSE